MYKRSYRSDLSGRRVGISKNEDVGGGRSPQEGAEPSYCFRGLRKNYCGTVEIRWSAHLGQQENTVEDAQKGQTSHPPNPGAPRRALSHASPQLRG